MLFPIKQQPQVNLLCSMAVVPLKRKASFSTHGSEAIDVITTKTYASTGNYTVTLTVTDTSGKKSIGTLPR